MNDAFQILYQILFSAVTLVFWALAGLVYLSARRTTYTRYWIAFCLFLSFTWILIGPIGQLLDPNTTGFLAARFAFVFGVIACVAFCAFGIFFLGRDQKFKKLLRVSYAMGAVLVVLFLATDLLLKGVEKSPHGVLYPRAGPLMGAYLAFMAFQGITPIVLYIRAFRTSRGKTRLQLGYMLSAAMVVFLAGILGVYSTQTEVSLLSLAPSVLATVAPALMTYAIIRHQLWDIRTVVHKTALWVVASSTVVIPTYLYLRYAAPTPSHDSGQAIFGALALFALFSLHFRYLQPWLDHRFSRLRHDAIFVVDRFSHDVLNLRGAQELAHSLAETLCGALYVNTVRVSSVEHEHGVRKKITGTHASIGTMDNFPPEMCIWFAAFDKPMDLSVRDEYEMPSAVREAIDQLFGTGTAVVVPFVHEGKLIGLVEIGEKRTLKPFSRADFILLERLRPPATVALSNARLYDELQDLMDSLEQRVQDRTAQLNEANERLRETDRARVKFFANITHELRTPLTLILAPLEDLRHRYHSDATLSADFASMYRNGLRLLREVNALLDLAKADAGHFRLREEAVSVNVLLKEATDKFYALARHKGLTLTCKPLSDDTTIIGDSDRLEVVLNNLLANALKFTHEGQVTVSAQYDDDNVKIAVTDTGIGIPENQIDRIFDRFAQVDDGTARRYEGTGIGLSLVKEVVNMHGGSVDVSSSMGVGSKFTLVLPMNRSAIPTHLVDRRKRRVPTNKNRRLEDVVSEETWTPKSSDGESYMTISASHSTGGGLAAVEEPLGENPRRVMIVEDNVDMQTYIARRLMRRYELTICNNAVDALEKLEERHPELVISDVMMPEISGFDLCKRIKSNPKTANIPVILLTARQGTDQTLEGFEAGADDYLTKPFNFRELVARIDVQLRLVDATRQLAQHEKASLLSMISAGLAHEVRNPINAVLNSARTIQMIGISAADGSESGRESIEELLGVIVEGSDRITTLVNDLVGVARDAPDEMAFWQFSESLDSTLRLLRYKHKQNVTVERKLEHTKPPFCRTAQANQVLMNLVDNAMRAAGAGGTVWVETKDTDNGFELRVRDSGSGIEPGLEHRIFDPLFSTHTSPDSTGLGLYIARRIITEHSGSMSVDPHCEETGGAEFIVVLPTS